MTISTPRGYRLAGVHAGIKQDPAVEDVAIILSDKPASVAGVYTQNRYCAAPVLWDRRLTPSKHIRAVVINSGNANACTGSRGEEDTREMARCVGHHCSVSTDQVLVMSTGIIGEFLPMDRITTGVAQAVSQLGSDFEHLQSVARGMMTTDTKPKMSGRQVETEDSTFRLAGLAKGSGMIAPNMATMLAVVMTDAMLEPDTAQRLLVEATERSFNCISVDGHTSTNDTVLLMANGQAASVPITDDKLSQFQRALDDICTDLARSIVGDGEGATHRVTVDVRRCRQRENALQIAKSVANSPLVKTAVTGADPNWGRIVSAAGYAGVVFDPNQLEVSINEIIIFRAGAPVEFDSVALSDSMRQNFDTKIVLDFNEGPAQVCFWTCDLTEGYIKINAEYHT